MNSQLAVSFNESSKPAVKNVYKVARNARHSQCCSRLWLIMKNMPSLCLCKFDYSKLRQSVKLIVTYSISEFSLFCGNLRHMNADRFGRCVRCKSPTLNLRWAKPGCPIQLIDFVSYAHMCILFWRFLNTTHMSICTLGISFTYVFCLRQLPSIFVFYWQTEVLFNPLVPLTLTIVSVETNQPLCNKNYQKSTDDKLADFYIFIFYIPAELMG